MTELNLRLDRIEAALARIPANAPPESDQPLRCIR
jgi:hypothetical protein